jgi:DNA polymerase-3 subunit epsilon
MRILIYDTETTGFFSPSARVVQFAAKVIVLSDKYTPPLVIQEFMTLVKTNEPINPRAQEVHGISNDMANHGIDEFVLAKWFNRQTELADMVAAHNLVFDKRFMDAMLTRHKLHQHTTARNYCTMKESTNVVKIPPTAKQLAAGRTGYKAPKLSEAYTFLTGKHLSGAHDALVDTRACCEVLLQLLKHQHVK